MSESTTPAQTSDELWNMARDAGLLSAAQGSNAFDLAIDRFAAAVRGAMVITDDGGPAFPIADQAVAHLAGYAAVQKVTDPAERDRLYTMTAARAVAGMTLRDYFAATALPRFIAHDRNRRPISEAGEAATQAYLHADAMIRARGAV